MRRRLCSCQWSIVHRRRSRSFKPTNLPKPNFVGLFEAYWPQRSLLDVVNVFQNVSHILRCYDRVVYRVRDYLQIHKEFSRFHRGCVGDINHVLVSHLKFGGEEKARWVSEIKQIDDRYDGSIEFGAIDCNFSATLQVSPRYKKTAAGAARLSSRPPALPEPRQEKYATRRNQIGPDRYPGLR